MSESLAISLREAIYDQITGSDDCYLLIYSGSGEKLSLLSSLLRKPQDSFSMRMMINLDPKQYNGMLNCEGCTLIDGLSKMRMEESAESFCLRTIREQMYKFDKNRIETSRILVIVDCSSFLVDVQEPLTNAILTFHRNVVDLIRSMKGATGILLYNIDLISDGFMSKLLEIHSGLPSLPRQLSPQTIKDELQKMLKASESSPEIRASDEGLLFIDPVLNSFALLTPVTDIIRETLPRDPLNIAQRDIAFSNNYTAHKGACPYFSDDLPSQCRLDPNIIRTMKTKGRSFIHGEPCITATDHMILEEMPEKKEEPREGLDAGEDDLARSVDDSYRMHGRAKKSGEPCSLKSCLNAKLREAALDLKGPTPLHP